VEINSFLEKGENKNAVISEFNTRSSAIFKQNEHLKLF